MTDASEVSLDVQGGVAHIRLQAPQRLNALTPAMMAQVSAALDEAARTARAILLSGEGRSFCTGVDLSAEEAVPHAELDGGAILEDHVNPLVLRVHDLRLPIVCAVQGGVAGIGLAIALCSDIVVAARSAYFLAPFARIGLLPDAGVAALLTKAVGRMRATRLLMLSEKLPAQTALEWGLISEVVDDDVAFETARGLAERLAIGPTVALGGIRDMVWQAGEGDLRSALEREREMQRTMPATLDCQEGNTAFFEKRPPRFVGR